MVTLIVQQYELYLYSCKEVGETSNGSWSVFCASLEFQGLKTQYTKKQSIHWQVGEQIIVAVTAVSTSHHADVEAHLLTEC